MPYCPKCGEEVPRKASFCNKCGTPIDQDQKHVSVAAWKVILAAAVVSVLAAAGIILSMAMGERDVASPTGPKVETSPSNEDSGLDDEGLDGTLSAGRVSINYPSAWGNINTYDSGIVMQVSCSDVKAVETGYAAFRKEGTTTASPESDYGMPTVSLFVSESPVNNLPWDELIRNAKYWYGSNGGSRIEETVIDGTDALVVTQSDSKSSTSSGYSVKTYTTGYLFERSGALGESISITWTDMSSVLDAYTQDASQKGWSVNYDDPGMSKALFDEIVASVRARQ